MCHDRQAAAASPAQRDGRAHRCDETNLHATGRAPGLRENGAIRAAQRADDMFGLLVASGIAVWFTVQSFINIGMTIGIMPITGLPLPFVSYGGSAVFADMIAIGLLQSVHRRHRVFELQRR